MPHSKLVRLHLLYTVLQLPNELWTNISKWDHKTSSLSSAEIFLNLILLLFFFKCLAKKNYNKTPIRVNPDRIVYEDAV